MGVTQTINGYKIVLSNDGLITIVTGKLKGLTKSEFFDLRRALDEFEATCHDVARIDRLEGATVTIGEPV